LNFLSAIVEVVRVTIPIFIIIAIGFFIRKIKLIDENGITLLNRLAYNIGLPALFFLNITNYRLSEIFDINIIKVIYSAYGVFFIILFLSNLLIKRSRKTRGAVFVSSFRCNMAFIGLPIIWAAYGNLALARGSLVFAFLVPMNILLTIILFRLYDDREGKIDLKKILKSITTDPIILSTVLGVILSYFGVGLPGFIHDSLDIISGMTVTIALLSIGASLKFSQLKSDLKMVSFIIFNKLILLPAIALVMAIYIFRINAFDRNVIVVLFSTPLAVAAYIMGKELRSNHSLMASSLIMTTIISAITISGWLLALKYL
jgi:predicted permease